eukprot:gene9720-1749_t
MLVWAWLWPCLHPGWLQAIAGPSPTATCQDCLNWGGLAANAIAWSPAGVYPAGHGDGSLIATGGERRRPALLCLPVGVQPPKPHRPMHQAGEVQAFFPDDGTNIWAYSVNSGSLGAVTALAWSPCRAGEKCYLVLPLSSPPPPTCISVPPQPLPVRKAAGTGDAKVFVYSWNGAPTSNPDFQDHTTYDGDDHKLSGTTLGRVNSLAFHPDGTGIATAFTSPETHYWEVTESGSTFIKEYSTWFASDHTLDEHMCVSWAPDGTTLAIAGKLNTIVHPEDPGVHLWDVPLAGNPGTLRSDAADSAGPDLKGSHLAVVWLPQEPNKEQRLVSGTLSGKIVLWKESGNRLTTEVLSDSGSSVLWLSVTPAEDSNYPSATYALAIGIGVPPDNPLGTSGPSDYHAIINRCTELGPLSQTCTDLGSSTGTDLSSPAYIAAGVFGPTGCRLATAAADGTAAVWDGPSELTNCGGLQPATPSAPPATQPATPAPPPTQPALPATSPATSSPSTAPPALAGPTSLGLPPAPCQPRECGPVPPAVSNAAASNHESVCVCPIGTRAAGAGAWHTAGKPTDDMGGFVWGNPVDGDCQAFVDPIDSTGPADQRIWHYYAPDLGSCMPCWSREWECTLPGPDSDWWHTGCQASGYSEDGLLSLLVSVQEQEGEVPHLGGNDNQVRSLHAVGPNDNGVGCTVTVYGGAEFSGWAATYVAENEIIGSRGSNPNMGQQHTLNRPGLPGLFAADGISSISVASCPCLDSVLGDACGSLCSYTDPKCGSTPVPAPASCSTAAAMSCYDPHLGECVPECDGQPRNHCVERGRCCCWEADQDEFTYCSDYEVNGYVCVGRKCSAMDPAGDRAYCAVRAPVGWIQDKTTGTCTSPECIMVSSSGFTCPDSDFDGQYVQISLSGGRPAWKCKSGNPCRSGKTPSTYLRLSPVGLVFDTDLDPSPPPAETQDGEYILKYGILIQPAEDLDLDLLNSSAWVAGPALACSPTPGTQDLAITMLPSCLSAPPPGPPPGPLT